MSEIITIDPRRIKAERAACIGFTTEELEDGLPGKYREAACVWEKTHIQAVVESIEAIRIQRDTALRELRDIREAIKANENESTADEVKRLVAKYDTARRTLEDHGPEGHNVKNQQYVDLRFKWIEMKERLAALEDIATAIYEREFGS